MEYSSRSFKIQSRVIHVSGPVNAESAPKLREKLRKTLDQKPQAVIVRLTDVTSMDTAGVAVLVEAYQWSRDERVLFMLADPSKPARSALEVTRLGKFFLSSGSVDRALDSKE
ncbi:MAG: STAS domain-containing protein [Planctomycetes bacterium]|nr:STAS domain-containing protein [Planctomycetota bacterium]